MVGKTVAHFEILRQIGSGGMGNVYAGRDLRLEREVALKFLPTHLSRDEEAKRRFMIEARAASALNHPGICTIFDIGETEDGQTFIAMARYEGETLKDRLNTGPISVESTVDIVRQVSEAAAAAHTRGIVHRDIKPANIFLTIRDRAVLLDFGVAKLTGAAHQTAPEIALGTPAYMSPEQLRGDTIDGSTDIWSLGVVLFEALAGRHPFPSEYPQAVIYSILNTEPEPVSAFRDDVPQAVIAVIERCLRKNQKDRYPDAGSLTRDLAATLKTSGPTRRPNVKVDPEQPPSIAVLPFTNLSADPEQEYFCDGMAEEIISALMQVQQLRVAARSSTFAFKGRQEDVRSVGEKLRVDMVLEGSVRRAGNRIRITAQLLDASRGFNVWSDRYDRDFADVFEIQDAIAGAIVRELSARLTGGPTGSLGVQSKFVARPTPNLAAYDTYLQGLYHFNKRTPEDNLQSIESFERATSIDPGFGLAFAWLAGACVEQMFSHDPSPDWERKAFVALEKAKSIDPQIPQIYVARGNLIWTHTHHFPHEKAIREYRQAIELDPNLAEAHNELARVLWHIGHLDPAHAALKRAMDIEPSYVDGQFRLAWLETHRGNFTEALRLLAQIPEGSLAPSVDSVKALAHLYLDRKEDGWKVLKRVPERLHGDPDFASTVAIFLARDGEAVQARERISVAVENGRHLGHFHHVAGNIADALAIMGEVDEAVEWLERAATDGFPCYPWFERNPCLQKLRSEPRYLDFMARLRRQWEDYRSVIED